MRMKRRGGPRVASPSTVIPIGGSSMSTTDPTRAGGNVTAYPATSGDYADGEAGYGWVLFAGCMLLLLATLNFIDGIAAVSNSKFFVNNAQFVISNLNTYGWVLICTSVVQALTGIGVFLKVRGVRWIGVAIAGVNAVIQMAFIPAYPFWSLALFTLDVLVMYGLIAHGSRESV
jgi:hypothetical protein